MRRPARIALFLLPAAIAACGSDAPTACCALAQVGLRVINAFTTPVDVLIDGMVVIQSLPSGSIDTAVAGSGAHTLVLRPTGTGASISQSITTTATISSIAAVRSSNGTVATAVLWGFYRDPEEAA